MLVISRKIEEEIIIDQTIEIKILNVTSTDNSHSKKSKVASIGIKAPRDINIARKELLETVNENKESQKTVRDIDITELSGLLRTKKDLIQK